MININLMIKERPRVDWRRVCAIAALGTAVAGFSLYALAWWTDYSEVQQDLADLAPLAESYRKADAQSGKLKEQVDLAARQEQALARIGRNQAPTGQTAVLRSVFAAAPPAVSVTGVVIDQEQVLLLTGQAPDFASAMQYLRALRDLPMVSAVEERKVATTSTGGTTFTFAAKVRREGSP